MSIVLIHIHNDIIIFQEFHTFNGIINLQIVGPQFVDREKLNKWHKDVPESEFGTPNRSDISELLLEIKLKRIKYFFAEIKKGKNYCLVNVPGYSCIRFCSIKYSLMIT